MNEPFLLFLFFYLYLFVNPQCTNNCICENYEHDETLNPEGEYKCSNLDHCKCNSTRMCSDNDSCIECSLLSLCPTIITPCSQGTYQSALSCVSCIENCQICQTDLACLQCDKGYYLDNNQICQNCSMGCADCLNSSFCSQCENEAYMFLHQVFFKL